MLAGLLLGSALGSDPGQTLPPQRSPMGSADQALFPNFLFPPLTPHCFFLPSPCTRLKRSGDRIIRKTLRPLRTIRDLLEMLSYTLQANSECAKKEIGLLHVVLKRPFGTMENNTQLCKTGKLTLQSVYDFFPRQEKPTVCLFWGGGWRRGNETISKKKQNLPPSNMNNWKFLNGNWHGYR